MYLCYQAAYIGTGQRAVAHYGWEGKCRFRMTLAIRQTGSMACLGDKHHAYTTLGSWSTYLFTLTAILNSAIS